MANDRHTITLQDETVRLQIERLASLDMGSDNKPANTKNPVTHPSQPGSSCTNKNARHHDWGCR